MPGRIKNIIFWITFSSFLISCRRTSPLFSILPASQTNISFENNLEKKKLFSILYYLYYYNGGGVATGDINNDGLPDIYFTANKKGGNKLYLNKGNFKFEDITDKAGVAGNSDWCTGVTMADVNSDGLLDIYVSSVSNRYGLKGRNELFINKGNSNFAESAVAYGLDVSCFTTQTAFFDYDRDGDLDCYILNQSHHPHANIVDTNNRRNYDTLSGDRLYRNEVNVNGHFTDVSKETGIFQSNLGYGLGIAVGDMNNDGWDDIYIGNDFHENDYYYINQQNGTFKEDGSNHFHHYSRFSMGNDIADYNNDGQLDVITVDMLPADEKHLKTYGSDENPDVYKVKLELRGYQYQYSKNCLQRNNNNGSSFSETGLMSGVSATDWSWAPLFADFDNDGNKDLFISSGIVKRPVDLDYIKFASDLKNKGMDRTDQFDDEAIDGMPDGSSHPFLFRNNSDGTFQEVSDDWGTGKMKGYYNGSSYADLDNDGKLDLVINQLNGKAVILKNNAPDKNYLSASFKGDSLNTMGVGVKMYVFSKGQIQYQQLMLTRGFESSSEPRLHFGMDSISTVDSILVVWPNQQYQVIKNISVNQQLVIQKNNSGGKFDHDIFFPSVKPVFEDITKQVNVNWKHKENDFLDYNVQYLIPHLESTRGPKIATGDVNKDGLDDFYVCGARFQPGVLMLQRTDGSFISSDTALFSKDAICEDVDATFFDANGDGFPDLYVVSGGNEVPTNNYSVRDRLYLNNGKGNFIKAENFITQVHENKSCVTTADFDKDGDIDLFVGNLADPHAYGLPTTSHLYTNDGKAQFTLSNQSNKLFTSIGMITAASFADINNDSWPDLIVTGEWMAVKIFINNKGSFNGMDISHSTGLWQTLKAVDVNGDGFTDILAGNWGHNSKLYAGKNGPLKLYIKDFDKNGSIEQIMAYTVNGKEYTFLAKDELERSLPVLKKAYLKYGDVAGKTIQYMFYDLFKDYQELKAEILSSSCFMNDGKGNFTRTDLPGDLQLAPIFSFAELAGKRTPGFIAAGNFYGTIPYEGRYDALLPTIFSFDKVTNSFKINNILPSDVGEVRDIKFIKNISGKNIMIVARNNKSLMFFNPL